MVAFSPLSYIGLLIRPVLDPADERPAKRLRHNASQPSPLFDAFQVSSSLFGTYGRPYCLKGFSVRHLRFPVLVEDLVTENSGKHMNIERQANRLVVNVNSSCGDTSGTANVLPSCCLLILIL